MENTGFEDFALDNEILRALEELGYTAPTEVQDRTIRKVLEGKDVIVSSRTGSGKTAAYAIPICQAIRWDIGVPQALVLVPTRELAVQVSEDINSIGRFKRIRSVALFGKEPFSIQENKLKNRTHVIVGTPGRLLDHIHRGLMLDEIRYLVIDEGDELLNMGFEEQVRSIITRLPENRTTLLFSATLPENIESLARFCTRNPERINIKSSIEQKASIRHLLYTSGKEEKMELLMNLLITKNPASCIIFANTRETVEDIFKELEKKGVSVKKLHGGMLQQDRLHTMDEFKRGRFRYLVATDVASRGIDVEAVSLIINYEVPEENETYVHRTGRTARAGASGEAITIMAPWERKYVDAIEDYTGIVFIECEFPDIEQVQKEKKHFMETNRTLPEEKQDKASQVGKDITKIYINGGRKKKIRPGDLVGAITSIEGVDAGDIGIIEVQDNVSYVDILNNKGSLVIRKLSEGTIKGKKLRVEEAKD